jgi:osmotically inducible protein OsmC
MASKASAVWTGSLKEGKGTISTATGVLSNANYSFATRFEGADSGTTPEELIAAAHASCFSMALGAQLGGAGLTPTKIETHAAVTLAKVGEGFSITCNARAEVAELADAHGSGPCTRKGVEVQVLSSAPKHHASSCRCSCQLSFAVFAHPRAFAGERPSGVRSLKFGQCRRNAQCADR